MLNRKFITPLMMGALLIMAVTGVLMFFHLDTGVNKDVHEWAGLAMVATAILHVTLNMNGLKSQLATGMGKTIVCVFVLVLAGSFINWEGSKGEKKPFVSSVQVLANAPIAQVAQISHIDSATLISRLQKAGVIVNNEQQSIAEIVGNDMSKQMRNLNVMLDANNPVTKEAN